MEFSKLINERYSCKGYCDKEVAQDKIDAILEAAKAAPTARNAQPQKIYVIKSAENLAKVDEVTPCRYGAPVVLMVTYNRDLIYTYKGGKYNSGAEDAAIVATHMMLAAADVGVDSCWLNNFDPDAVHEIFALPENETVALLLDIGYKGANGEPKENHFKRKDLTETVVYL